MKRKGDGTDSDAEELSKKGDKVDDTESENSRKKEKKGDGTDCEKSRKKVKKGDDTESEKSRKKEKKRDGMDSEKSRKKVEKGDGNDSKKSRKKGDATDSKKSGKKRRKVDDTESEKSRKKVDGADSEKSRKKRGVSESETVRLPHIPVPIIWGRRSKKDAKSKAWNCKCGTTNDASRHVFIDLPSFRCSNKNCHREKKKVNFRFSYGNMLANGVCPIGKMIYNQKNRPDCFLFALAKGCETAANIRNLVFGNGKHVRPMNPYSFKKHLEMMNGGVELAQIETGSARSEQRVRELLATEGISEIGGQNVYKFETLDCHIFDALEEAEDEDEAFALADQAFEDLATALADGSPVVTSISLGRKFKHLEYGKLYKSPAQGQYTYVIDSDDEDTGGEEGQKKTKMVQITHSVVLVGAAREGRTDYYYFLNSHGVKFCVRVDNETGEKTCGIGKICAEDGYTGLPFKIMTFG